jgi:hypothetical protein
MTSSDQLKSETPSAPTGMKKYDRDVPVDRITVSLDADLAGDVRLQAELEGRTVSAWIAHAARASLGRRGLAAAIADYEAEFGAFTEEEMVASKTWLGW